MDRKFDIGEDYKVYVYLSPSSGRVMGRGELAATACCAALNGNRATRRARADQSRTTRAAWTSSVKARTVS